MKFVYALFAFAFLFTSSASAQQGIICVDRYEHSVTAGWWETGNYSAWWGNQPLAQLTHGCLTHNPEATNLDACSEDGGEYLLVVNYSIEEVILLNHVASPATVPAKSALTTELDGYYTWTTFTFNYCNEG